MVMARTMGITPRRRITRTSRIENLLGREVVMAERGYGLGVGILSVQLLA